MTLVQPVACNAQYVNVGENASDDEMQNFEKQVIAFLNTKLGTCIESSDTIMSFNWKQNIK